MLVFCSTFPILLILAISYMLTSRKHLISVEFAYSLISYQFIFIALLGIGLIQSHIGCPMPLDECYVDGYPPELDVFKTMVEVTIIFWVLYSVAASVYNLAKIKISRKPKRLLY
jgi:hypothetical protein